MTTEFFSRIGEQLCAIKNSPFYPLGRPRPPPPNASQLIHTQLSYNPDRLFNEDKYQEQQQAIQDPELLAAKRQEEKAAQKIEIDILQQATLEDYNKRIQDLQRDLDRGNTKLAPSIFKIARSACLGCSRCAMFRGSFGLFTPLSGKDHKQTSFMSCTNCGCPMGAHAAARYTPTHRNLVWKYLKTKELRDEHLNFGHILLGFRLKGEQSKEEQLWNLQQILQNVGFFVERQHIVERGTFQYKLLRCYLMGSGDEPGLLQAMLQLAESIEKLGGWKGRVEVGDQFREQLAILHKIGNVVRTRSLLNVQEDDKIAVFLVRNDEGHPGPTDIRLALKQMQQQYMPFATLVHVSGSKRQALFQTQQFFLGQFQLHSRLFLLPRTANHQENAWKLQDLLDYSGYFPFLEGLKNIKRDKIQNLLSFLSYHQITYLLGKDMVAEKVSQFPLFYSVKTGMPQLKNCGDLPAFVQVKDQQQRLGVLGAVLPNYMLGQRCVIVLRPLVSDVKQAIVNVLRLNGFVIIQRRKKRLTLQQAYFLSALQHITKEQSEEYMDMMSAGSSEILLVSKRGALYQAQALINPNPRGLAQVSTCWIKEKPVFQVTKGRQLFRQELNLGSNKDIPIFSSCGEMLSIERCLFGSGGRKNVLQNCRTGELIKVQNNKLQPEFKGTSRQRDEILKDLRQDSFNYLLFNSKSDKSTEELASIFFPESTLFESAVVLVKPAYSHLIDTIKDTLAKHRFHLIHQKTVQFSKLLAFQLLSPLQKIQIGGQTFDEVVQSFTGKKVTLLCISKIGARKQLLATLASFTFLPPRTAIVVTGDLPLLQEALIPVWTNEEIFLKLFSRHLSSVEEAVQLVAQGGERLKGDERMYLLQYFVGSLLGVRPNDLALNTSLGRLSIYNTEQITALYQSWFYASFSQAASDHVPLLFQYRTFGAETLVIQSFAGEPFMAKIVNHYREEVTLHKKNEEERQKHKKRGSLVLFLWAKKIFKLAQRLSGLDGGRLPPIEVQGWGAITNKNGQYCAQHNEAEANKDDKVFLERLYTKYQKNKLMAANIKKMLDSRILVQRFKSQQRRLLPHCGETGLEQSLRVVESGSVGRLFLKDEFQMIDPDHQKQVLQHHDLLTLQLYRVQPFICPKYHFLSDIFLFFERWREEALQYRQVFAEIGDHLKAMVLKFDDLQFLQYEMYLQMLRLLEKGQLQQEQLKTYPMLRKNRQKLAEEAPGKNRKFLQQKQYFKPLQQHADEKMEDMREKLSHFNLKTLTHDKPAENHILNRPNDPLHLVWNTQQNFVNLLRDNGEKKRVKEEHKGVYVQYEKQANENEKLLKEQLQSQVDKLENQREEHILKDNGLDPDLWYKRVKQTGISKLNNKVDDAIKKQLEKLNQFKQTFKEK